MIEPAKNKQTIIEENGTLVVYLVACFTAPLSSYFQSTYNFGWVGFLVVCFLYEINPNARENTLLCWEKVTQAWVGYNL